MHEVLLEPQPDARLRVYAVWFSMFPTDARERWRAQLLPDPRVVHYWDETRSVGRTLFQAVPELWPSRADESKRPQGGVMWDSYLLFGPDVRWDDEAPQVLSWGYTILMTRARLQRDLNRALGAMPRGD